MPSGVWHEEEYNKLPQYDGDIPEQLMKGGNALFLCHNHPDELCAGWVGCHGPHNLLALRLHGHKVDSKIEQYKSPVPLFATGQEAADNGRRELVNPSPKSRRMVTRLNTKIRRSK